MTAPTAAFFCYLLASVLIFGLIVVTNPGGIYVGSPGRASNDPSMFIWAIAWWPYAIRHAVNPFLTNALWAPVGFNVAWSTSVPGLSLAVSPITYLWGPIVSYNVLSILAPAINAWAAFLLCRVITKEFWAPAVAGFVYGFSPHVVGHLLASHLILTFIPFVPLAAYVAVRFVNDEISASRTVLLISIIGIAQFLISVEVFATLVLVGALALVFGLLVAPESIRLTLWRLTLCAILSCLIVAVGVSPYIYCFLFHPESIQPAVALHVSTIRGLLVPSSNLFLSHHRWAAITDRRFWALTPHGDFDEPAFYLGPLLLLIAWSVRKWRESLQMRFLLLVLLATWVLSLGPFGVVFNRAFPLPWWILWKLPLLEKALPARLSIYSYLAVAVIAAVYLRQIETRRVKLVTGVLIALCLLPDFPYTDLAISQTDTPPLFLTQAYQRVIKPNDIVLALPFGLHGNSMIWQAQTGMYFRLAEAWTGSTPTEFVNDGVASLFDSDGLTPADAGRLRQFVAKYQVDEVILPSEYSATVGLLRTMLAREPVFDGGIALFRTSAGSEL